MLSRSTSDVRGGGAGSGESGSGRSGGEGDDKTDVLESGARVGGPNTENANVLRLRGEGRQM